MTLSTFRALVGGLGLLAAGPAFAGERNAFETDFRTFAGEHCVSCHGPDVQRGKLRLDKLPTTFDDGDTAAAWVKVFDRVSRGEMPPKGKTRPPEKETRAVL